MSGNRYLVEITTGTPRRRVFLITDKEEEDEKAERLSALQEWHKLIKDLEDTSRKFGSKELTIETNQESGDFYMVSPSDRFIKLNSSDLKYLLESMAEYKKIRHDLTTLWSKYGDKGYEFKKIQQGEWRLIKKDDTGEASKA